MKYKNTHKHSNADALSRFRHESVKSDTEECDEADVFALTQFEQVSLNSERIKRDTTRDKMLSRVYEYVMKV